MMNTDRRFKEITELCQRILRTAEAVTQKCGNRHRSFLEASWELERVWDTCFALKYFKGCEIARHYQVAARTQSDMR